MFKKMFTLLIAVLFVVPFVIAADDFDDDFGGDEEDSEEAEEEEEEEEAPAKKEMSESDAAMKDLMGDPEEEKPAKKGSKADVEAEEDAPAEAAATGKSFKGVKPVLLVKGGFSVLGSYKYKDGNNVLNGNSMFGSVDEGIAGVEYQGAHVIAKGTLNLRTDNALIKGAVNNPLVKANLHSIQDGVANALYEVYGGVKFYDVFIKAGKMLPEYGLVDTWQELGMGFATPFLTRSLIVVEGFLPETDAGISLGYNGKILKDHNVFAGISLGTGSVDSDFWDLDKTMGIYGRIGYGFKDYLKAAVAFQYRTDFYQYKDGADSNGKTGKNVDLIGIGVHLRGGYAGFEMPVTFDYNIMKMVKSSDKTLKSNISGMLISAAPGYAYHFNHEWVDKVALALRFDFIKGVYLSKDGDYLDYTNFKDASSYYRIGVTANFFTKELAGIRGMAGLTFLMQPEQKLTKSGALKDYGFTTVVLQAGAEF